jgi:hypothetical protein
LKIRLKYPEHTSYCIGFEEEFDESADDDEEEDDNEEETADESDNHSKKQKLFIFYSVLNKKEKHMMPKVIHSKLNIETNANGYFYFF